MHLSLSKRTKLILGVSLSFIFRLYSLDFTLTPLTGIKYGSIGESLYDAFDDTNLRSYLKWDQKPAFTLGLRGQTSVNNIEFGADLFYALPLTCGKMQDYDWNDAKTNKIQQSYTKHDNKIKFDGENNLWIKYRYKPLSFFTLSPALLINNYYLNFSSTDGYGYHGSSTVPWDNPEAKYVHVSGIDYSQYSLNVFYGLDFTFAFLNKFTVGAEGYLCPFTYIFAFDHHRDDFGKNRDFYEKHYMTSYFSRYKVKLYGQYEFNKKIALDFNISFLYGKTITGKMYYKKYQGEYQLEGQPIGSDIKMLSTTCGVVISL